MLELRFHLPHQGLELHGRGQVALELESAAHEGAGRAQLPVKHVYHQLGVCSHGHISFSLRAAWLDRATVVLQVQEPVSRVFTAQDEVIRRIDLRDDVRAEQGTDCGEYSLRGVGGGRG